MSRIGCWFARNRRYWPGLARNLQALAGKFLGRFVESSFAENQQADVV